MDHCLDAFKYCPRCGSAHFRIDGERSRQCEDCGFTYFLNASAATAAFIVREGADGKEILVGRRAQEPAKGTLDLPGGFVDPGESVTDGIVREVREEVGCEGEIVRFLFSLPNGYEFSGFRVPTADCFFEVKIPDETAVFGQDDCVDLEWVALKDVRPEDFGLDSIRKAVEKYIKAYNS